MRVRLGAVALGVVLVAGSVGWIWWSARTSSSHTGFGAVLSRWVKTPKQFIQSFVLISANVFAVSDRPGFAAEIRTEIDLLRHIVAEFDRTNSEHHGIMILELVDRRGLWAPTGEHVELRMACTGRVKATVNRAEVPPAEGVKAIRSHLASAPRQPHPGSWMDANFLTHGETETSRVLWSGYAINAATVGGFGLIGWGSVGAFVAIRARRRIGKDQCAKCRYDLRGLAEGVVVCPECGAERVDGLEARPTGEVAGAVKPAG